MTRVDPRYVSNAHTLDVMELLPDTIAGVQSPGGVANYELNVNQRGLGYAKKYISQEPYKNITVYSYHNMLEEIPDGVNNEIVQQAFVDSATSMVLYAQEELEELDMGETKIRGMPFLFAAFGMPQQQGITYIFMTGFNNTLVKVRYDHPFINQDTNLQDMMAVKEFMDELVRILQESTGEVGAVSDEWI
jgi:hypothetical protein